MGIRALVDAGPLIGWLNARDQWSVEVLSRQVGALYTTGVMGMLQSV